MLLESTGITNEPYRVKIDDASDMQNCFRTFKNAFLLNRASRWKSDFTVVFLTKKSVKLDRAWVYSDECYKKQI